ncbi:MAG TPA: hypothetical protein VHP83_18450, partial [Aggregatilineaceae bacterium]|nr:hypothetical protein [Aggregatilineaceae bacterium]
MLIAILVLVMAQLLPHPALLVTTMDGSYYSTSTVWNVDPLTGSADPIYTLPTENGILAYDSFPADEILKMEDGISAEAFPAEWPTTYPILQHIIGAWQFDDQHLLIQTTNELCDRRTSNLCYGYFEFSILNPVDTSEMESLIKIPYHNRVLEQWPECTVGIFNTVYVDQVAVNPVFEQVALTIRATNDCRSPIQRSTIILIDSSGAAIVEISDAGRLGWSPLGDQFAYYRQEHCLALLCPAALYVHSTASHETITVASSDMIEINFRPSVAWIDNQRLLYSWMVQINAADSGISLNEYDL